MMIKVLTKALTILSTDAVSSVLCEAIVTTVKEMYSFLGILVPSKALFRRPD